MRTKAPPNSPVTSRNSQTGRITPASTKCLLCGIPHNRHSFAVRTLLDAYRTDGDPVPSIAALSTYLGHLSPTMTMRYARTLAETHEREFLRYRKVTADGRQLDVDPRDLYDMLELVKRADRILPNGYCLLPPRQSCDRGNACLTCDKFATDRTHLDEHQRQLSGLLQIVDARREQFQRKTGKPPR
jgi:hypothetical protein